MSEEEIKIVLKGVQSNDQIKKKESLKLFNKLLSLKSLDNSFTNKIIKILKRDVILVYELLFNRNFKKEEFHIIKRLLILDKLKSKNYFVGNSRLNELKLTRLLNSCILREDVEGEKIFREKISKIMMGSDINILSSLIGNYHSLSMDLEVEDLKKLFNDPMMRFENNLYKLMTIQESPLYAIKILKAYVRADIFYAKYILKKMLTTILQNPTSTINEFIKQNDEIDRNFIKIFLELIYDDKEEGFEVYNKRKSIIDTCRSRISGIEFQFELFYLGIEAVGDKAIDFLIRIIQSDMHWENKVFFAGVLSRIKISYKDLFIRKIRKLISQVGMLHPGFKFMIQEGLLKGSELASLIDNNHIRELEEILYNSEGYKTIEEILYTFTKLGEIGIKPLLKWLSFGYEEGTDLIYDFFIKMGDKIVEPFKEQIITFISEGNSRKEIHNLIHYSFIYRLNTNLVRKLFWAEDSKILEKFIEVKDKENQNMMSDNFTYNLMVIVKKIGIDAFKFVSKIIEVATFIDYESLLYDLEEIGSKSIDTLKDVLLLFIQKKKIKLEVERYFLEELCIMLFEKMNEDEIIEFLNDTDVNFLEAIPEMLDFDEYHIVPIYGKIFEELNDENTIKQIYCSFNEKIKTEVYSYLFSDFEEFGKKTQDVTKRLKVLSILNEKKTVNGFLLYLDERFSVPYFKNYRGKIESTEIIPPRDLIKNLGEIIIEIEENEDLYPQTGLDKGKIQEIRKLLECFHKSDKN